MLKPMARISWTNILTPYLWEMMKSERMTSEWQLEEVRIGLQLLVWCRKYHAEILAFLTRKIFNTMDNCAFNHLYFKSKKQTRIHIEKNLQIG